MALCFLYPIHVLLLYLTLAKAAFSLSPELAKFIPSCAQECFESFLDANYNESQGGASPSLQFFCSTQSTSGNTVGEGAVSCIISEDNVKLCTGNDAQGTTPQGIVGVLLTSQATVVAEALEMCNGQPNALPNTHSTITATLVMVTSGVVVISPATTSGYLTHASSARTTAISRPSSNPTSTTSSLSQTTGTSTSSVMSLPPTQNSSKNTGLTKNQIVGISVAGVGGAAVVIGAMALVVCLRRRKLARRGSDMLPFQTDPAVSEIYGGMQTTSGKQNLRPWGGSPTPPPVPPRLELSPPNMFSRRSIPDNIGLAVSPDRPNRADQRYSKLLPEKPTLRLVMPNESQVSNQLSMNRRQVPSMQSTVTQFEEDDGPSYDPVGTRFRGPDITISTTIKAFPSVPKNTTTSGQPNPSIVKPNSEDFSGQYINRIPYIDRTVGPGPTTYIQPSVADRPSVWGVSGSLQKAQDPSQSKGLEVPNSLRPLTQASSVYSQPTPHTTPAPFYYTPGTRQPSLNISEANAQSIRTTSYKQIGPYDRGSSSSLTSFESEDAGRGKRDYLTTRTSAGFRKSVAELSPVEGSPSSGKSPVSYPTIPGPVRLKASALKMVPPPPQPDFGAVFSSRSNPNANMANKPWLAAEIAAQQQRNLRREELRLSRATRPSPQSKPGLLPAAQIREKGNPQQPVLGYSVNQKVQNMKTNALRSLPSQQQSLSRPLPPEPLIPTLSQSQEQSQMRPYPQTQMQSLPQQEASNLRPGAFLLRHSRSSSTTSANSTSSSLLAKRLGVDKAAALHLNTKSDPRDKIRPGWRVLKQDEIEAAKDPGWRPQLLQQVQGGRQKNGASDRNGDVRPETGGAPLSSKSVRFDVEKDEGNTTPPPVTPGWVPKLTPTRRGNELFLSVQ